MVLEKASGGAGYNGVIHPSSATLIFENGNYRGPRIVIGSCSGKKVVCSSLNDNHVIGESLKYFFQIA